MRPIKLALLLALTLLPSSHAQEARFFRVAGPVATTITACNANGYVTWTNAPTNATFTVQTASSPLSPSNWVDYVQVPVTNPVTTHRIYDPNPPPGMAFIPAGSFTMGSDEYPFYGEQPTRSVHVSAFYMDRSEVTKALWDDVYNWAITHGYSFDYSGSGKASNHPVQSINWFDCVKWCNARSEMGGKTPAYYTSAAQTVVYRNLAINVATNWVKWNAGYRLPTEAEWEKAARGGSSGHRFPWSNVDTITHSQANYSSSSNNAYYDISPTPGYHPMFNDGTNPYTSPAGYFAANGYGLYDMGGNVWEWCWDWHETYPAGSVTDPRGPASGSHREFRGGGWGNGAFDCRTARRYGNSPTGGSVSIGFRSALPSGQ